MRWWTKIDKYQVKMNSRSHFFQRLTSARLPWFSFSMFYRAKQHHQPERSGKKRGAICWKYLLWQSFVTSPVVGKTRRNFSPAGQQPARHLHLADEPPMFLCLVNRKRICPNICNLFFHPRVNSEPDIFVWPSKESTLALARCHARKDNCFCEILYQVS